MDYITKRIFFNLSALHGARITEEYDEDGNLEKGIFIPLERNDLHENNRKCVYIYAFANFNHWEHGTESYQIVQSVSNTFLTKLKSLGYGRTILGYMRDVATKYSWKPHGQYIAQVIQESKKKK